MSTTLSPESSTTAKVPSTTSEASSTPVEKDISETTSQINSTTSITSTGTTKKPERSSTIGSTSSSTTLSTRSTTTTSKPLITTSEKEFSKSISPSDSTTIITSTTTTKKPEDGDNDICDKRNPCLNGGSCESEGENDYKCICVKGYSGKNCDDIEWCAKNKDICGGATCQYDEVIESGFCYCKDGLYFNTTTKTCKALDLCLLQRIKGNCSGDHETCDKSGKCICEENYSYNKETCEPDFCGKKNNRRRCGENMECHEGDNTYICSCKENFRLIGAKCVAVDKCAPGVSKCAQRCSNGKCTCFTGFKLNNDGYSCDPKENVTKCGSECGKGICLREGGTEKCNCPQVSHTLKNNTCIDKCEAGILKKECPEEMGCLSDDELGYKCNCTGKYDYAEDGVHCKAKLMCSEGGGDEDCASKGGVCEDDFTSTEGYTCKCKFGYEKDKNTHFCEHKCKKAGCDKKQALCSINVENVAECICPPLLVKDKSGICNQLAKFSYLGDFSVPKRKYQFVGDSGRSKRDTSMDINYAKLLKDFEDSMGKVFDGYKGASLLNCTKEEGNFKCFLEIKLNKDPQGKLNIISTPSVCIPISEEDSCLIPPDFITKKRTADDLQVFHKTNPCDKGVIEKLCGNETFCAASKPGFSCKCKPGYFRRSTYMPAQNIQVDVCEDLNECFNPTICPNTTYCYNLPGSYTCKCNDGYRIEEGKSPKKDGCRHVCDPNPCTHGICSESGQDGFSCICEGLYTGRFCNQTNEAIAGVKEKGKEISGIVGGVLGAFLVVAIIICIILFRKVRKSKSIDDTEDCMRTRNQGLVSEMWKLGRRQPESRETELRDNERRPNRESAQLRINPIDSISIPRPQLGRSTDRDVNRGHDRLEKRESGDYRRGYSDDDRMIPRPHSSRQSGEEVRRYDERQELPPRPLSRSSNHMDNERIGVSRMQYRNRGYEDD